MTATGEPTTAETDERKRHGLVRFATANVVVVVSLIGASAFFVTRLAQTSFYREFGLEPEDVGLSYTETLSRASAGLVVWLLVLGAMALVFWLYFHIVSRPKTAQQQRRLFRSTAFVFASTTLIVLVYALPASYAGLAGKVKDGKTLRPAGTIWGTFNGENPLGIHVERVHVSWIDDTNAAYDFGRGEVMYLGRATGAAMFFDPRTQRTVRVPAGDIVIERKG